MKNFDYLSVESAREAVAALAERPAGSAKIIAGGTDLLTLMKAGLAEPQQLISIRRAGELHQMRFDADGTLHLGALTTLADIERDTQIAELLPILRDAVRDAASPQLRAMATIGGNLLQNVRCWYYRGQYRCWLKGGENCYARGGENKYHAIVDLSPCVAVHPSDVAPALVALDAQIKIEGPQPRTVAVAEFLQPPAPDRRSDHTLGQGEVITEISIPGQPAGAHGVYLKAMDRHAWSFALGSVAAQVVVADGRFTHVRLALGAVANVPVRAHDVEDALSGQDATREAIMQATENMMEKATPLAHNSYKVRLSRELARRALLQAARIND